MTSISMIIRVVTYRTCRTCLNERLCNARLPISLGPLLRSRGNNRAFHTEYPLRHYVHPVQPCSADRHTPGNPSLYSLDRTPSNRNLTSFRSLLLGFQSSNCFNNSTVSSRSSFLTNGSSMTPRAANGSMYGFCEAVFGVLVICKGITWPRHVVSNACSTARLLELVGNTQNGLISLTNTRRGLRRSWNALPRRRASLTVGYSTPL